MTEPNTKPTDQAVKEALEKEDWKAAIEALDQEQVGFASAAIELSDRIYQVALRLKQLEEKVMTAPLAPPSPINPPPEAEFPVAPIIPTPNDPIPVTPPDVESLDAVRSVRS